MPSRAFRKRPCGSLCAALTLGLTASLALAAPGGIISNGSNTDPAIIPSFLFEPEVPFASLKTQPTWDEIEQLLDNPYLVTPDPDTPGTEQGFPSYRATGVVRRPGFGVTLPALLVHPLNYNPTTGEEMRLLNRDFPETPWQVPDQLEQVDATTYEWTYKEVTVSPGAERVQAGEAAIDYNSPFTPDSRTCILTTEANPPEGSTLCGGDPGEPNYFGFGVNSPEGYSTPAVPGVTDHTVAISAHKLFDPERGVIQPRNPSTGAGGLRKPSLRVPPYGTPSNPGYLVNTDPGSVVPSSENDFVKDRNAAIVLGKALFWDMQVGSDGVQSCGTCHFHAGADNRTRNQLNPNFLGGDVTLQLGTTNLANNAGKAGNYELKASDFPFHKLASPDIAGDPACTPAIVANVSAVPLDNPVAGNVTVCSAANIVSDVNDIASSMGVRFRKFNDIPAIGDFISDSGVNALRPDIGPITQCDNRAGNNPNFDPVPGFRCLRRVEPRNTPTLFAADMNFDNFWDGRARHDFNGGSVFGASDPQKHVFVNNNGTLVATRQIIRFASLASLATGPALSNFEMSFDGRNWAKLGKKLLQAGVTPLANQMVDPTDSVLGPYSNSPKPGLNISYVDLIKRAFYPALWNNTSVHLERSRYPSVNASDPFDGLVLTIFPGAAQPTNTNQFTQMEANMPLFFGLAVHLWGTILVPDDTPFDRALDGNPDAFVALGEAGETGLVADLPDCGQTQPPGQRPCFTEVGPFKRDSGLTGHLEDGTPFTSIGTRGPTDPDPLRGLDLFFGSNLSLKNPNFRSARCGECHAVPTLTDHTMPFTSKIQLGDFSAEFTTPGIENPIEPLGRLRVITGFLLESEINENGQDGVERRVINQSVAPNPVDGLAYPDGLLTAAGAPNSPNFLGAGTSFFDNGVYNLGVTPILSGDIGRGGNDPFGWPLSLAALMMKNLAGPDFEPGPDNPNPVMANFDPALSNTGGLFEETAQDQQINPGVEGEPADPQLPLYLAPWANNINVGDAQPELDEAGGAPGGMVNTLTDTAMLEGFLDTLGPFNPAGILAEVYNGGDGELMGTWPMVNRVARMGSFKAAQLRNVELTGPYFHNGGKLTLRQVVDFYTHGGDFPVSNAAHRDFNLVNLNLEVQSNLSEAEKVSLVDFLLQLTDDRVRYEKAPFDRPEIFAPLDGTAPDNTFGRTGFVARTTGVCTEGAGGTPGVGPCFRQIPAVGAAGAAALPNFLGVSSTPVSGPNNDHYDH